MGQAESHDEILQGPGYFRCEKYNTRMLKIDCVKRQSRDSAALKPFTDNSSIKMALEACEDCEQGRKIKEEIMADKPKPRRGTGERNLECEFYKNCLDIAVRRNWKTWKCNECPRYDGTKAVVKPENTRVCEECGENKTITPKHALCAACLGKKGRTKKKPARNRKKAPVKHKKKNETPHKPQAERPLPCGDTALRIDFGRHVSVLRAVERLADEEMRPVDLQVVFLLKTSLDHIQESGGLK